MLSLRKVTPSTSRVTRLFGTLVMTEEFPGTLSVSPKKPSPPVLTQTTLSNGIKIISYDNAGVVASFNISIASGSRGESINEKGSAQLLAAGALSGTKFRSGLRLSRDLEELGANFKSFADREKITFEISAPLENVEKAFGAVAEAIASPLSEAFALDETKPIAEALQSEFMAYPKNILSELLHEASYGEYTPLGGGLFPSSMKKLDVEEVIAYQRSSFVAGNITVTASGIPHESLQALVQSSFQGFPASSLSSLPEAPYVGGDMRVRADLDGETYVGLAFPVSTKSDAYEVLTSLFTARFLKKQLTTSVDEKISSKVIYFPIGAKAGANVSASEKSVAPFLSKYSSGGIFGFHISGSPSEIGGLLQDAITELKAIASGSVSEQEILAATTKVSLEKLLKLEGGASAPSLLASSPSPTTKVTVTATDLSTIAKKALASTPSYAVYGSTYGVPTYSSVVKMI